MRREAHASQSDCHAQAPGPGAPKSRIPFLEPAAPFASCWIRQASNMSTFPLPGTSHEWLTWRRDLNDFAPRLFR